METNQLIHRDLQACGQVEELERRVQVLVAPQEMTGADRQRARQYDPGYIVRYTRGSKVVGIEAGEYARVEQVYDLGLAGEITSEWLVNRPQTEAVRGDGSGHVPAAPSHTRDPGARF